MRWEGVRTKEIMRFEMGVGFFKIMASRSSTAQMFSLLLHSTPSSPIRALSVPRISGYFQTCLRFPQPHRNRCFPYSAESNNSGTSVTGNSEPSIVNDTNFDSGTNDSTVNPNQKAERIVVLGGSGFVGCAVCKFSVAKNIDVVSLSRSGRPSLSDSWADRVMWRRGDIFDADWGDVLGGATAVISTVGGFGRDEEMKRINGEANIRAVNAARREDSVRKFVFVSVHDYNLPPFLLSSGYFAGKRAAELELLSKFPNSGVVLRPGFIYGRRRVKSGGFEVPLHLIGAPLERLLKYNSSNFLVRGLSLFPGSDLLLTPPLSVDDVAAAAVNGARDDHIFGVLGVEQIKQAAAGFRV